MDKQVLTPEIVPKDPAAGVILDQDAIRTPNPDPNDAATAGAEADQPSSAGGDDDAEETAHSALAKSRGWVEEKDWKGKGAWTDAKSFNERYEHIMPVVSRENKRLRAEMLERDQSLADMRSEMDQLRKFQQEQSEARAQIEQQTLMAERASALEQGDYQRVVVIDDKLLDMKVAAKAAPKPQPKTNQVDPAIKRTVDDFLDDNPVFRDPEMKEALNEAAVLMRASGSPLQNREFLDKAKTKVERWYPDKFVAPKKTSMMEMNGSPGHARGNGRTWNDLKPEYREALDAFIRNSTVHKAMGLEKARASILKNADDSSFRRS